MIIKLIPPLEEQRGSGDPQLRVDKPTTIFSAYLETMLSLPYGRHQRANKTLISFTFFYSPKHLNLNKQKFYLNDIENI